MLKRGVFLNELADIGFDLAILSYRLSFIDLMRRDDGFENIINLHLVLVCIFFLLRINLILFVTKLVVFLLFLFILEVNNRLEVFVSLLRGVQMKIYLFGKLVKRTFLLRDGLVQFDGLRSFLIHLFDVGFDEAVLLEQLG